MLASTEVMQGHLPRYFVGIAVVADLIWVPILWLVLRHLRNSD